MRLVKYVLLPALRYMMAQEQEDESGRPMGGARPLAGQDGAGALVWQVSQRARESARERERE